MKHLKTKIMVGFSITFALMLIQNIVLKKDKLIQNTKQDKQDIDLTNKLEPVFKIHKLTDEDLKQMNGKSFEPEKSISHTKLRKLTVTYIGFDEKDKTGEIIVNETVASEVLDIFKELYEAKYPIEKIRLIDYYNGDDVLSMDDNNSSAYNHRYIAGTEKLSTHAMGLAVDINPIQNPFVKNDFVSPLEGENYLDRNENKKGMVIKDDICYNAFVSRGWIWGGDWQTPKDYQHFEKIN